MGFRCFLEKVLSLDGSQVFSGAIPMSQTVYGHLRDSVVVHKGCCDHQDVEYLMTLELNVIITY